MWERVLRRQRLGKEERDRYVSIRQHASAYISIRQHTSAYVSIRQHTFVSGTLDKEERDRYSVYLLY